MPTLPKADVYALQQEHGYGMIRVADGVGQGYTAIWATAWPPPERMLLIVPVRHPATMVELPDEPHHLVAMREGLSHGWQIYEMERGDHSKIPDADAKGMTHVVRVAEYHQREAFQP